MRAKLIFYPLIVSVMFATTILSGCADHHYYRAYDPYHNDYHTWDSHENVYYQQWVVDTHRDPHRGYKKLSPNEQKEYWNWRHDHDHDHH